MQEYLHIQYFTVIDICTSSLSTDSEIISFAALRFENGVPNDRFFEYVNSGVVLSDSVSDILGITNNTLKNYGTTMEDAYWQFIEFCYDSELVTAHYNFDMKLIERICKEYDLPTVLIGERDFVDFLEMYSNNIR